MIKFDWNLSVKQIEVDRLHFIITTLKWMHLFYILLCVFLFILCIMINSLCRNHSKLAVICFPYCNIMFIWQLQISLCAGNWSFTTMLIGGLVGQNQIVWSLNGSSPCHSLRDWLNWELSRNFVCKLVIFYIAHYSYTWWNSVHEPLHV